MTNSAIWDVHGRSFPKPSSRLLNPALCSPNRFIFISALGWGTWGCSPLAHGLGSTEHHRGNRRRKFLQRTGRVWAAECSLALVVSASWPQGFPRMGLAPAGRSSTKNAWAGGAPVAGYTEQNTLERQLLAAWVAVLCFTQAGYVSCARRKASPLCTRAWGSKKALCGARCAPPRAAMCAGTGSAADTPQAPLTTHTVPLHLLWLCRSAEESIQLKLASRGCYSEDSSVRTFVQFCHLDPLPCTAKHGAGCAHGCLLALLDASFSVHYFHTAASSLPAFECRAVVFLQVCAVLCTVGLRC